MSYLVNNELLMTIKWKWIKHLTRNILVLYIILIRNIFSDISVSVGLFSILFCPQTKAGSQPRFSYISEYQFRCRRPQCVHWSEVTTAEKIAVAALSLEKPCATSGPAECRGDTRQLLEAEHLHTLTLGMPLTSCLQNGTWAASDTLVRPEERKG